MKLALLEKWHKEVCIFFLVSTPDGVWLYIVQTRHHLLRWGKVGTGRDHWSLQEP